MPPEISFEASSVAHAIGTLAERALWRELDLTPKPGLVDRANAGAHRDMNCDTFARSIAAIARWFPVFFATAYEASNCTPERALDRVRVHGRACERDMFETTNGVNTHKGAIFSLGLLCAAAGRLHARRCWLCAEALCAEVSAMTSHLVERELAGPTSMQTAGERLYHAHGITGARGEAQSGFATARRFGLSVYRAWRFRGAEEQRALLEVLVSLMAHNVDTNVLARGGLAGLAWMQSQARRLLDERVASTTLREQQLRELDHRLIDRNLSPGGSADLLAVTWFLANVSAITGKLQQWSSGRETWQTRSERAGPTERRIPLRVRARSGTIQ